MPFSSNWIFLEETSLVARPGLSMADIQERMVVRLKHFGHQSEKHRRRRYPKKCGKIYGPSKGGDKENSSVLVWTSYSSLIYWAQEGFLMHFLIWDLIIGMDSYHRDCFFLNSYFLDYLYFLMLLIDLG